MTVRLCVHWPRLGPYHLARLQALHALCVHEGAELVALETSRHDATYAWDVEADPLPFQRVCAMPEGTFEGESARTMDRAVTDALDAIDPDAVAITSYSTPDARAALAWCRRRRRVAVMMFDSRADDADRAPWREAVKRAIVRAFDAALVAGAPQRAYAVALGLPPSHVFTPYDVVDNAFFAEGAARVQQAPETVRHLPGLASDVPFLLTSGRFVPRKNLNTLVEAYARYRADGGPWRLVLLGDGPEREGLERQAHALGLSDVTFAGFQQADVLPAYYGRAAAYVHPARTDQWGLVVNEAMASGLPVLVSRGAGCALDLVEEGANGATFDPDDAVALADALRALSDRPPIERAAMGRRSAEIMGSFRPEDFASGLWAAVEAGRARSERALHPAARAALTALRLLARSPRAFHTIPD